MEKFLGETMDFWIKVRAALRKAEIETIEELEARLGVTPPIYEVDYDHESDCWEIVSRQPQFINRRVVGWTNSKVDACHICLALRSKEANGQAPADA